MFDDYYRPNIERTCPHCGTPFKVNTVRQFYCTERCANNAWRKRRRAEKRGLAQPLTGRALEERQRASGTPKVTTVLPPISTNSPAPTGDDLFDNWLGKKP